MSRAGSEPRGTRYRSSVRLPPAAPQGPAPQGTGPTGPHVTVIGRPRQLRIGGTAAPVALGPGIGRQVRALLAREHYDIVHLHEPLMPMLPLQFLRQGQPPMLGTFHASEPAGRRLYRFAAPALRRWTRRLSARTAISETALATARPVLGGPCQIVPGCTDLAHFATPAPPPPSLANDHRRTILFVGRAEPRKGLSDLIEAYGHLRQRHADLRLVVVGPPGRQGAALRARVESAGWSEVIFAGPVPDAALPGYYQAAHVFVAPATAGESFGLVLAEAMAAGAPVVAGDNPRLPRCRPARAGWPAVTARRAPGARPNHRSTAPRRGPAPAIRRRRTAAGGQLRSARGGGGLPRPVSCARGRGAGDPVRSDDA